MPSTQSDATTGTLWLKVGRLLRRQVRAELRRAAMGYGVELEIDEERTFFDSTFFLTVHGVRTADYIVAIQRWAEKMR